MKTIGLQRGTMAIEWVIRNMEMLQSYQPNGFFVTIKRYQ